MSRTPRNRLDAVPLRQLQRMLRATELTAGQGSDGAKAIRRAIDKVRIRTKKRR